MPASIYSVKLLGHDKAGNQWNNILHYICTASSGSENDYIVAKDLATSWYAGNATAFLNCLPSDSVLDYISCTRINQTGGNAYLYAVGAMGTGGAGISTIACGACLKFLTATARQFGRMFLAGIWDGAIEGDLLAAAYKVALDSLTASLAIVVTGTSDTYTLTVYSRKLHTALTVIYITYAAVIGIQKKRRVPVF